MSEVLLPGEVQHVQQTSVHLKNVLKSYQTASMTSLSGPNAWETTGVCGGGGGGCGGVEGKLAMIMGPAPQERCSSSCSDIKAATTPAPSAPPAPLPPPPPRSPSPSPSRPKKEEVVVAADHEYDPFLAAPPFPIQQIPILAAADQSRSELSETILEGQKISCFIVGGEKRLCLPQLLNSVFSVYSLPEINRICDLFMIFCSRCTVQQLEVLKMNSILPYTAPSCGLITKTDAERLNAELELIHVQPPIGGGKNSTGCSSIMAADPDGSGKNKLAQFTLRVYHDCFGKCEGIFTPDLYTSPRALCVECVECRGLFAPQKFVCHAHKRRLEKRTCHWGFDSANWRSYILLAPGQTKDETLLKPHLDEMKARFDYHNKYKRKQYEQEEKDLTKKVKYAAEDSSPSPYLPPSYIYDHAMLAYWYPQAAAWSRNSAFRPWSPMVLGGKDGTNKPSSILPASSQHHPSFLRETSVPQSLPPYLSHGPPVLLNPERVVPISETERFERHYQPNVALAPASAQLQANQKMPPTSSSYSSPATAKSNHERIIMKAGSNPEMEVSTDTDETLSDSTISAESTTDYVPDTEPIDFEKKMDLGELVAVNSPLGDSEAVEPIRKLLDARGVDADILEDVMRAVEKLRIRHKEELSIALHTKMTLQQELEYVRASKKEKLREAAESKRSLRKELKQLQQEHEHQMKEALESQQMLRRELDSSRVRRGEKIHEVAARANLAAENEQLRSQLAAAEKELRKVRGEAAEAAFWKRSSPDGGAIALMSIKDEKDDAELSLVASTLPIQVIKREKTSGE